MLADTELEPILAAVIQSSLDCIVVIDEAGRVLEFNPAAEATFGYARDEALGRSIGDLIVPERLRARHHAGLARYVAGESAQFVGRRAELPAMRRDGSEFPAEITVTEVLAGGRRVFTATMRDLSARGDPEELERTRHQLELAVAGAQLGVWSYDPRTGVSWYSDRVKEIVGLEDNLLADGEPFRRRVHPEDRDRLVFDRSEDFPDGPVAAEYRIVREDGEVRWLHSLGAADRDEKGEVEAVRGVIIDITERKQAEEALHSMRRQLELAVEGAKLGVWTFDPEDFSLWYSERSRELYGLGPGERITPERMREIVHPDDWRRLAKPYYEGYPEGPLEIEYRIVRDGEIRWMYALGAADRDEEGRILAVNGVLIDITDRKRAEQELAEARRHLELAVEGAKIGIWTVDPKTGETWYSDRSRDLWGLGKELHLDANTLKSYIHPDDWPIVIQTYRDGFPRDTIAHEIRVVWPSGETRWVQSLGHTIRDEDGKVTMVTGIHIDVTERKRAEEELARSRDALHQSEKLAAMGSLLAGVSHELNNPLAAIVGQAEMLQEDAAGTGFEARAKRISAAAERCSRIVQTFLAMARQKETQRTLVDVNALIGSALEITEYGLRTAGVSVRVDLGRQLPQVEGDSDQLHQVLVNLIVNAQQAMEKGETFEKVLGIRTSVNQAGRVLVDVSDSGPGVPAELSSRIFDPFFTTRGHAGAGGTGIGLSFSQGIAEAHGGKLTLEPSRRGAHFRIELPAAAGAPAGIVAVPTGPFAPIEIVGSRQRALVVEDEPDVAATLCELLEREGFEVTVAANGTEAFFALDKGEFDLLFSDLRMPLLNGPELYARLTEIRPQLVRHMAFVTGDTMGDNMAEFLRTCDRPILEKPFTRAGVRAVLAALLAPEAAK